MHPNLAYQCSVLNFCVLKRMTSVNDSWKYVKWIPSETHIDFKLDFLSYLLSLSNLFLWRCDHSWLNVRYRFSVSIYIFCHIVFILFTFLLQIKIKCAKCALYSIFTLKIFSTTLQNLICSGNSSIHKSRCHILTTFWTK